MSIKIKRVKINGVRGSRFNKNCRNSIEIDGKSLLLFGNNGDGKSTFYDSIEWVLTGSIEEIKNRRMKENEINNILKNKFCSKDEVPYVHLDYKKKGVPKHIKKKLGPGAEKFPFSGLEDCFIDLGRIERFVVDTRASHWNRFSGLLGLEEFNEYITKLERLYNEVYRKEQDIANGINVIKKEIENKEKKLEKFKIDYDIKDFDIKDIDYDKLEREKKHLERKLERCRETIECLDEINKTEKKIKECDSKIGTEKDKIKKINGTLDRELIGVLKAARIYLTKTKRKVDVCPVCLRPGISKGVLIEKVESSWRKYEELDSSERDMKELKKGIEGFEKEKERVWKDIRNKALNEYFPEIKDAGLEAIDSVKECIRRYYSSDKHKDEKRLTDLKKILGDISIRTKIGILNSEIVKAKEKEIKNKKEFDLYGIIRMDVDKIRKTFSKKIGDSIKLRLEKISRNDITYIYNRLNISNYTGDTEIIEEIKIEADVGSKEIMFLTKFKNFEKWDNPVEFLSTGHLRCLGFAILMGQAKRSGFNLYVFDDPIASLDYEHRYCLINYLNELSKGNNQLIITTSDLTFYEIMQHMLGQRQTSYKASYNLNCGTVFFEEVKN